jgi:hypothetical protein
MSGPPVADLLIALDRSLPGPVSQTIVTAGTAAHARSRLTRVARLLYGEQSISEPRCMHHPLRRDG